MTDRRWTPEWFPSHPGDAALAGGLSAGYDVVPTEAQARCRGLQLHARKGHDVLSRLHRVSCPTFVASGSDDDIAPMANGQAIVERIPVAELHVYDAGHLFLVQDPAAWRDAATFLADAPRTVAPG